MPLLRGNKHYFRFRPGTETTFTISDFAFYKNNTKATSELVYVFSDTKHVFWRHVQICSNQYNQIEPKNFHAQT